MGKNVENFANFKKVNEGKKTNIKLTNAVKKYFWSKIEFNKKKKAKESENELYTILTSDGDSTIDSDTMTTFLNSLEYSMKKQMKDPAKKFRNGVASDLQALIPSSWVGVKYSSLTTKDKKDAKEKEDKK